MKKAGEELQRGAGRRESWREVYFEDVADGDHPMTKDGKRAKWIELFSLHLEVEDQVRYFNVGPIDDCSLDILFPTWKLD